MNVLSWLLGALLLCSTSLLAQTVEQAAVKMLGANRHMETVIYEPSGSRPQKAVLLLHTSSGLRDADHRYARRLATEGYLVLVPAFMKAYDISEASRRHTWSTYGKQIYADLQSIIETIRQDMKIAKDDIHALGFSNGGHWSALLAARGDVKSAVSYYGAFSEGGTDRSLSTFRDGVKADSRPLLILHGESDAVVNRQYAAALEEMYRQKGARVQAHFFDGAGHSFDRQLGPAANRAAADEAWRLTLQFLREH